MTLQDTSLGTSPRTSRKTLLVGAAALLATFGAGCSNDAPAIPPKTAEQTLPTANQATNPEPEPVQVPTPAPTSTSSTVPVTPPPVTATPAATATRATPSPAPVAKTKYKDGTYAATGSYQVPAGPEEIEITITVKGDIITASTFKGVPRVAFSKRFMEMFGQNYQPMVVGKKLSDLQLGNVSGSSLTPKGFNNALEKIKARASVS